MLVLPCEKTLTLASCLQVTIKDVWTWADSLNLRTTHLLKKNFRIQAINGILRPECVHQCLRNKTKCAAVLVNEIFESCWLLKCFVNLKLLQKDFLELSNGWNYYANDNSKSMKIKFKTKVLKFFKFILNTCICF